ncbi:MAG: VOC family protein [Minwuia sp.]|nr:VOC family protein [Minwuia sp.]
MRLDHVNVRSRDLEGMRAFFETVVGLTVGDRPDFDFPGYWLYGAAPGEAIVHLVGIADDGQTPEPGPVDHPVDHFAFRGGDYDSQVAAIRKAGLKSREVTVPGRPVRQVFVKGPESVTVELQFPA